MRKIKLLLTTMFAALGLSAYAQTLTVTGTVTDSATGEPVPAASVIVKGAATAYGVATDIDGHYSINVASNAVLSFSSIGYETTEVSVNGKKTINVRLDSDAEFLDAAVKIGYGSSKRIGNKVGAVTTVKADIVKNSASQSPLDRLQGQVAGMQVLSTGGVAGDNSISMKIHGVGSLSSSSEPLFIIDGIQSNSTMVMNLNPNDILSISVLKDASSTSIYGSLGANGIVYVTTKGGHFNEKATVTVHTQWGVSTHSNLQFYENMMNSSELTSFWIRAGIMTPQAIEDTYYSKGYTADTKWHHYFQNLHGLQCQNDVTIEGGSNKVAYMFSASQFHQDGNTIGNYYDRYTLRSNIQARPTDWLKAGVNFTGYLTEDRQNGNWNNSGGLDGAYTEGGLSYLINPLFPAIDPNTGKEYPESYPNGLTNQHYRSEKFFDNYNRYGINGSAFLEIELYKGLILASRVGTDSYIDQRDARILPSASFTDNSQRLLGDYYTTRNTITNTLEYSHSFKNGHDFSVLLGQEGIKYLYKYNSSSSMGQTDDRLMNVQNGLASTRTMSQNKTEYAFLSFFGHADYSYAERYFIDATVRYDASSRFGKNNRWAPFWAVGAMWNLKNESWLKDIRPVDRLSLKLSYGTQGNANIPNYEHLGTISSSTSTYNGSPYLYLSSPSNESLTWEKQRLFTTTIDARFWDRLDAEISVYNRVTSDMLMSVPQPYTTGFSSVTANVGAMCNTGIDITLGVDILKGRDYGLNFNTTFNYNAEKVTELFDGRTSWEVANTGLGYVVGSPVMYYFPIFAGVDPEDGAPTWYLPGEDKNVCTMDPQRITKEYNEEALTQNTGIRRHEPVSGGFGLRGHWRGLSFNVDFSYFAGKYLINNDAYFYANPNRNVGDNQIKSVSDFWTPYNTDAEYPDWSKGYNMEFDTHLLENASFLRLKNLTVGYSLSQKALGTQKVVKGVMFSITGRNLWTLTNYTGIDPEIDGNLTYGIPGNTLQVLGGIEIKF